MQNLSPHLLARLRAGLDASFLMENFVFSPTHFPSLAGYLVDEDAVEAVGHPRAIHRTLSLRGGGHSPISLELGLILGIDDPHDTFQLLVTFVQGFQRELPMNDVVILNEPPVRIGSSGLAWEWDGGSQPDVLAFLRGNVLVTVSRAGEVDLLALAREIDSALRLLDWIDQPVTNPYYGAPGTSTAAQTLKVRAGGSVALHLPMSIGANTFAFMSPDSGSLSREPGQDWGWIYHAEFDSPDRVTVTLLGLDDGIVPRGAQFSVEITG